MSEAGMLYVPLVPTLVAGARAMMDAELLPPAKAAGVEAGSTIGKGIVAGIATGSRDATAAMRTTIVDGAKVTAAEVNATLSKTLSGTVGKQLAAEMKTAEDAVIASGLKMQAANEKAVTSAAAVGVAEKKLAEARAKYAGDSSQVAAAENRLAEAERRSATAAEDARIATVNHTATQATYVTARNKVADAEAAGTLKTAEAEAASGRLDNTFKAMFPTLDKLRTQYGQLGALIGVTLVAAITDKAIGAAGNFETSQERLVTTAGELQSSLALVSAGVLQMAGQVGYSAQAISTGMYTVESAGFHGAEGLTVMKAAAQGAKEENADLGTVTDAVTSVIRDYALGANDAGVVTSKLVTAVGEGKTNFQDFTGSLSAVLPKAAAAHVDLNDILGDLASMTLHGMSAAQASQNLADALSHLSNPTAAMTKELSALGINAADLSKNLGKTGVSGAMIEVEQAVLQHMGPAGTTLLNSFNQSKQAAADAAEMFGHLPPAAQKVAQAVNEGTLSFKEFRKSGGGLAVDQKALVDQWLGQQKAAMGFSDVLKTGSNAAQTFSQAMAKATGDSSSLNVALMLTGENTAKVQDNIAGVASATTEAGGNVKGWADIQATFNQKMDEFKAGLGAVMIELGQQLLPVVTAVIGGLMSFSHWLSDNRTWLGLVASVLGALLGPLVAVKMAMMAWSAVTSVIESLRIAMLLLNAAMLANPVLLLVSVIAALVAGLVYAYFHFTAFRNLCDTIWRFIAGVFIAVWHALGDAVQWVVGHWKLLVGALLLIMGPIGWIIGGIVLLATHWREVMGAIGDAAGAVWRAVEAAFHPLVVAAQAVGDAAVWLYEHAIRPAFDGIALAAKILAAIVFTVLVGPLLIIFRVLLAPLFHWFHDTVVRPVFDRIADAFRAVGLYIGLVGAEIKNDLTMLGQVFVWLYDAKIKPFVDFFTGAFAWCMARARDFGALLHAGLDAIGSFFTMLWTGAIGPFFNSVGAAFVWLYDHTIKWFLDRWVATTGGLSAAIHDLWDNHVKLVLNAIGIAFSMLYQLYVQPTVDGIMSAWRGLGSGLTWVYDNVITPCFNGIKTAVHAVGTAFDNAVGFVQNAWNKLKAIVRDPVNWVLDVVLNQGLFAAWNWIATKIGLSDMQLHVALVPAMATGGILPGYAPGVDSVPALLSPGEAVLTPGAARALGHDNILALNAMYAPGRGYAHGGLVNPLMSSVDDHGVHHGFWGGVVNWVSNTVSSLAGTVGDVASGIAGWVTDPVGSATKALQDVVDAAGNIAGGSDLGKLLMAFPKKIITSLIDKVKSWFSTQGSGGGGAIPTGDHLAILTAALTADGVPQGDWPRWLAGLNTLITRESGWNPGAINLTDSNAAAGHPSQGLMQTIPGTFASNRNPSLPGGITDPVANVAAGINYILRRYGDIGNVQQANASAPPRGYDTGGWIPPGTSAVVNASGRPEPVFSPSQWDTLKKHLPTAGGGHQEHNYYIEATDPVSVAAEIERRQNAKLQTALI